MMLPHVIRFNGAEVNSWYHDLLECTAGGNGFPAAESGADGLADFVAGLARHAELPSRLSDCGVQSERLPQLAAEAAKQWTSGYNPRKASEAELLTVYEAAF
jgi:alcohol dehydrogenase class IV